MKLKDIDAFFREVDRHIDFPITVILTGGAAAIVFGVHRATQDIDFEVELHVTAKKKSVSWKALMEALNVVAGITKIAPEFSEDIDRWSSIALPGKESRLWKKIGKVEIRIFDPAVWAVGKLSRYLSSDESDLVEVFETVKPKAGPLVKFWGKALGISPPSPAQSEFKKHVDSFLDQYAARIWGKKENAEDLKRLFLAAARTK